MKTIIGIITLVLVSIVANAATFTNLINDTIIATSGIWYSEPTNVTIIFGPQYKDVKITNDKFGEVKIYEMLVTNTYTLWPEPSLTKTEYRKIEKQIWLTCPTYDRNRKLTSTNSFLLSVENMEFETLRYRKVISTNWVLEEIK